ncbi:MAG: glycerol-3-phosphate acyltransferase [Leptolyngbyaceae bacterium]|nr:glycerol-3-phosphate acyltransferase [Leptolyngbyaceae bacterium]
MTLMQVWGALLIFVVCPILGGLPLVAWITYALTRQRLAQLGTGNISVSAAFYHGGKVAGILAVLSEAGKGIAAVLLARAFFPQDPEWELIALIALVMGRYWIGRGAGTTNVVWGYVVHDWLVAVLVFLIGGVGFTLLRERQLGRIGVLVLFPLITALRHPHQEARIGAAIALATIIGVIYQKIPDDLNLAAESGQVESQKMFRFFQGTRALLSLDQPLDAAKVGQKAATLSQLKRWGYAVPKGWVLPPGDDPEPLITFLKFSERQPWVVRSSAIGEDSEAASAAGQYESILQVTNRKELREAIARCLDSYNQAGAAQYRQDRGLPDDAMAVLVQAQITGVFSGVAFSRDPITRQGDRVVIEALPGGASRIVSGKITPEQYQVSVRDSDIQQAQSWVLPDDLTLEVDGEGEVPPRLIQQVAFLARHLESRYHGIPQDIEWSYDGQTLWLLQSRPVTTLLPIWTRKIAAEVIPGVIRPLTWSVNRPLTCGVWGEIFTLVLGERAQGLDFNETASLHYARAYFNASLLGDIFRRMGLPAESLEFLTRGAKFSKPPLLSTLSNVPGLLRLANREWQLVQDWQRDYPRTFKPALEKFAHQNLLELSPASLLEAIHLILALLKQVTYYSILAPLSAALRQALLKVPDTELDNSQTPEVAALRSLQALAKKGNSLLPDLAQLPQERLLLLAQLATSQEGQSILKELDHLIHTYGYLSEVGTDIAVPTWQEHPQLVQDLFTQFWFNPPPEPTLESTRAKPKSFKAQQVQQRVDIKGKVTAVYSQFLAYLRGHFVALEQQWLASQVLTEPGDIFFLEFEEIKGMITNPDGTFLSQVPERIAQRRSLLEQNSQLPMVPSLVYGKATPQQLVSQWQASQILQGIGASPGQAEGQIKVLVNFQTAATIDRNTILVVPYTDSGWAPLLARAGGLISEVGGRLSHGAIVAREYGIPAVMDIPHATQQLKDGQRVRIDGQLGKVEIL